jgi:hypothetical protein
MIIAINEWFKFVGIKKAEETDAGSFQTYLRHST